MSAEFFETMAPYAQQASQETGVPVSVILAQWALESGYGTSRFAKEGLNFGGIKLSSNSPTKEYMIQGGTGAKFAKYSSISQFVEDYVRVLKLGYYKAVREAGDALKAMEALAQSPYDAGGYAGGKLQKVWSQWNLQKYDDMEGLKVPGPAGPETGINIPAEVLAGDKRFLGWFLLGVGVLVIIRALGGDPDQVKEVADRA